MGLLTDDEGNPRWRAGGIVLAGVLALFLLPPILRNKDISHPLSAQQSIDLCSALPEPPPPVAGSKRRRPEGGSTMCEFAGAEKDVALLVGITTTRDLSSGGRAARTSKFYQTWLQEVTVSGAKDVREQPGKWAMGASYVDRRMNNVLIEDHGVMLTFASNRLDTDALVGYARAATETLRKPHK
jgi:hypothetical protein